MNTNVIDLTTDTGFSKLASMVEAGNLQLLKEDTDIQMLIEKQAYADASSFADISNKLFCIATPVEAYISANYAMKCANDLSDDVLFRINEACDIFNLNLVVAKSEPEKVAKEMFEEKEESMGKYAGVDSYGTELDTCLAARAINAPEYAEDFEKLASMKDEIAPSIMVQVIHDLDVESGLDFPQFQSNIGSPEYAVYEKRASYLTIDLGSKSVAIEKLAELQESINDMGVDIDFDSQDAYATKLAIEGLPIQIKKAIASLC